MTKNFDPMCCKKYKETSIKLFLACHFSRKKFLKFDDIAQYNQKEGLALKQ